MLLKVFYFKLENKIIRIDLWNKDIFFCEFVMFCFSVVLLLKIMLFLFLKVKFLVELKFIK